MNKTDRAYIFQSFDALKGFREVIKAQEVIKVERPFLSEDDFLELNRQVQSLVPGMMLTVIYFKNGSYIKKTGQLSKLDFDTKSLQIVKEKLFFKDILKIDIEK